MPVENGTWRMEASDFDVSERVSIEVDLRLSHEINFVRLDIEVFFKGFVVDLSVIYGLDLLGLSSLLRLGGDIKIQIHGLLPNLHIKAVFVITHNFLVLIPLLSVQLSLLISYLSLLLTILSLLVLHLSHKMCILLLLFLLCIVISLLILNLLQRYHHPLFHIIQLTLHLLLSLLLLLILISNALILLYHCLIILHYQLHSLLFSCFLLYLLHIFI